MSEEKQALNIQEARKATGKDFFRRKRLLRFSFFAMTLMELDFSWICITEKMNK